jgi:hypothetical protein
MYILLALGVMVTTDRAVLLGANVRSKIVASAFSVYRVNLYGVLDFHFRPSLFFFQKNLLSKNQKSNKQTQQTKEHIRKSS